MVTEAELLARAREMRRNPTELEKRLWRHLSNTQLGHKFRRQQVLFPYICDFFCPAKGLVIEVDGDTHDPAYDERRDAFLLSQGFLTLRFSNHDVFDNLDGVLAAIVITLRERSDRWSVSPHPNPSPEGEGLKR
jgi:very-short-patch-repair endonuclease